jgi:hypothetical protein
VSHWLVTAADWNMSAWPRPLRHASVHASSAAAASLIAISGRPHVRITAMQKAT